MMPRENKYIPTGIKIHPTISVSLRQSLYMREMFCHLQALFGELQNDLSEKDIVSIFENYERLSCYLHSDNINSTHKIS
jgi:hypothetical protein